MRTIYEKVRMTLTQSDKDRGRDGGDSPSADRKENDFTEAYTAFTKEMYKKQLEIFQQWNEMLRKNIPDPEESKVLTKIVMDRWKAVSDRIEGMAPELMTPGPGAVEGQKRLVIEFIDNYNQMLKEIMSTSQFASMVGTHLTRTMEQRRDMEKFRDEVASNMGLPTRSDIRDIHESIYFLNKRFDDLERLLRKALDQKGRGGDKRGGR